MFWYEGKLVENNVFELDIYNPAFLYGATVFTTIRVYHKSLDHPLTNWNYHLDRLDHSIKIFHWKSPDWESIRKGSQQLLKHFPVLRITILPDGQELIMGRDLPPDLLINQQKGISGWVADKLCQRHLSEHKTGNYLGPWLALQNAHKQGAQEAILTDRDRHWLETSTGNLWGYKDGIWFTPSLQENILPGIMRRTIMEKANFPIQENIWNWTFVKTLEAIAYSNCVIELIPFRKIKTSRQELILNINHKALNQLRIQGINRH